MAVIQPNNRVKKPRGKGKPFVKGDERINKLGRPKGFDELRALAVSIGQEQATKADGTPILWNKKPVTWAEFVIRTWLTDKRLMTEFRDTAYGKVPQKLEGTGEGGAVELVIRYVDNKKSDDQPS